MRPLFLLLAGLISLPASAQAILNLDFEPEANRRQPLLFWARRQQPDELLIRLDTLSPARPGQPAPRRLAGRGARGHLPRGQPARTRFAAGADCDLHRLASHRGLHRPGLAAGLVGRADRGPATRLIVEQRQPRHHPAAAWQQLRLQVPVSQNATSLYLITTGRGRLWTDNFQAAWPHFRAAGLPVALLDLRPVDLQPGTQWLFENLLWRDGALKAYVQPFTTHSLRREFDVLLYLPKSTPA